MSAKKSTMHPVTQRLKDRFKEKGVTVADLVRESKIELAPATVSRILYRDEVPGVPALLPIAYALGFTAGEICEMVGQIRQDNLTRVLTALLHSTAFDLRVNELDLITLFRSLTRSQQEAVVRLITAIKIG